ncbi:hypothetical protein HYU06_01770 [Candidatus Woesearchaeota archaeon]|nr:hypothetical protein [Candidatus Woesearchaeota archaeon]
MFKFLKSIFVTKEITKEEVALINLLTWYNEKADAHFALSKDMLFDNYGYLNAELANINNTVSELASAQIEDEEKVESRIKQIVLSQRTNFIRAMTVFTRDFGSKVPKDFSSNSAILFCNEADTELDNLSKSTIKSFYTAQHLFHTYVEKIGKYIASLSAYVNKVRNELKDKEVEKLLALKTNIQDLLEKNASKDKLIAALGQKQAEIQELETQKLAAENKLIELQKSKVYNDYLRINDETEFAKKNLAAAQDDITSFFEPLARAFKKFAHITVIEQKLIAKYAESPIEALKEDASNTNSKFKILTVLENLEKNIIAGSVELKDKEKEKALSRIKEMNKETLKYKLEKLEKQESAYKENAKKLNAFPVLKGKASLEHELAAVKNKLKFAEDELAVLERRKDINYEELQQKIVDDVRDVLSVELTVI